MYIIDTYRYPWGFPQQKKFTSLAMRFELVLSMSPTSHPRMTSWYLFFISLILATWHIGIILLKKIGNVEFRWFWYLKGWWMDDIRYVFNLDSFIKGGSEWLDVQTSEWHGLFFQGHAWNVAISEYCLLPFFGHTPKSNQIWQTREAISLKGPVKKCGLGYVLLGSKDESRVPNIAGWTRIVF